MNTEMVDPETGRSFEDLDPRLFSYNSPHGWCPVCRGYGTVEKRPAASMNAMPNPSSTPNCARNWSFPR